MTGKFFIGPLRHWLLLVAVLAAIWLMGRQQLHISNYRLFMLLLLGLAGAAVAAVVLTFRRSEQITRDSLEDDGGGNGRSGG